MSNNAVPANSTEPIYCPCPRAKGKFSKTTSHEYHCVFNQDRISIAAPAILPANANRVFHSMEAFHTSYSEPHRTWHNPLKKTLTLFRSASKPPRNKTKLTPMMVSKPMAPMNIYQTVNIGSNLLSYLPTLRLFLSSTNRRYFPDFFTALELQPSVRYSNDNYELDKIEETLKLLTCLYAKLSCLTDIQSFDSLKSLVTNSRIYAEEQRLLTSKTPQTPVDLVPSEDPTIIEPPKISSTSSDVQHYRSNSIDNISLVSGESWFDSDFENDITSIAITDDVRVKLVSVTSTAVSSFDSLQQNHTMATTSSLLRNSMGPKFIFPGTSEISWKSINGGFGKLSEPSSACSHSDERGDDLLEKSSSIYLDAPEGYEDPVEDIKRFSMRNFFEKKAFPSVLQSASQQRLFPQLETSQTAENRSQYDFNSGELKQSNESVIPPVLKSSTFRRSLDSTCSSGQEENINSLLTDISDESSQSSSEDPDKVKLFLPNTTAQHLKLMSQESLRANLIMQKSSNDSMSSLLLDSRISISKTEPKFSNIQTPLANFDNQSSTSLKEVSSYLSFSELQILGKRQKKTT